MENAMQVKVVHPSNRWNFSRHLMEMHHHRKQVFVDTLGWQLAFRGSWLEVDQFDDDFAVYIMVVSVGDERHLGSVRLLPTSRPHMLNTIFADLCPDGAPCGEDVWEISRFVAAPDRVRGTNSVRVHRLLAAALAEFALLNQINRYTLVAETRRMPALLSVGWSVLPLSLPTSRGGEPVEAMEILMDKVSIHGMGQRIAMPKVSILHEQRSVA